jgi:uncharacterized protein YdaT
MPWTPSDARRHTKKAITPKQKRQWADIANSALKRGLPEAKAIQMANGVLADPKRKA